MWTQRICAITLLVGALIAPAAGDPVKMKSTRPGGNEADAVNQAIEEAAATLLPAVRDRVAMALKQEKFIPAVPPDESLQQIISASLREGRMIRGRTVEVQSRPYGNVYYATLTLDVSPKWMDDLARRGAALAQKQRDRNVTSFAGVGGLIAVVSVLYFAANTFTKGYYRGRLRLMAVTAAVVGTAAVAAAFYGTSMQAGLVSSERTIEHAWQN